MCLLCDVCVCQCIGDIVYAPINLRSIDVYVCSACVRVSGLSVLTLSSTALSLSLSPRTKRIEKHECLYLCAVCGCLTLMCVFDILLETACDSLIILTCEGAGKKEGRKTFLIISSFFSCMAHCLAPTTSSLTRLRYYVAWRWRQKWSSFHVSTFFFR